MSEDSEDTNPSSAPIAWQEAAPLPLSRLLEDLEQGVSREALGFPAQWPCIRRYQTCGKLGQGGMSSVWKAYDPELGRPVAIKLLQPDLPRQQGDRLWREAQALAKLSHPNVVQVYEVVTIEGHTAVVMELLEGSTLRAWQEREPRPGWRECVSTYLQAGRGLAAAHSKGLVHRDFKPDNCIVDVHGRVRVLDFGLVAQALDEEMVQDVEPVSLSGSFGNRLTLTGMVVGTVAYMPPERFGKQARGVGVAGDQFSFCTSLYEALYGERPFSGNSKTELVAAIERGLVRPPRRGSRIPSKVRQVLLRGLVADPERRWLSMDELLTELERMSSPSIRRPWLGVTMLSVATLSGILAARCGDAEEAISVTGTRHAVGTWARIDDYAGVSTSEYLESDDIKGPQAQLLLPEDPERAVVVKAVRARLSRGRVRWEAGKHTATEANATDVLREARQIGYEPLIAEALLDRGELRVKWPEYESPREDMLLVAHERGEEDLEDAYDLASRSDHHYVQTRAASLLARRLVRDPLRIEAAEWWGWMASSLAMRPGTDRLLMAEAASAWGSVVAMSPRHLSQEQRREEVLARYGRALPIYEDVLGPLHPIVAETLESAGDALLYVKDPALAQEHYERALAICEASLGSSHPAVGRVSWKLGKALIKQEEPQLALAVLEQALDIQIATMGTWHPSVARTWTWIGIAFHMQGRLDEALVLHRLALDMLESTSDEANNDVIGILSELGFVLRDKGRIEDALAYYEETIRMRYQVAPDSVPNVLSSIGRELAKHGRPDLAEGYHHRALDGMGPRISVHTVADAWLDLGDAALVQGYHAAAIERVERAFSILDYPTLGALTRGRFVFARVYWTDPLRRDEARHLAELAWDGYRALDEPTQQHLAWMGAWLEEAYEMGQWAEPRDGSALTWARIR